MRVEGAAEGPPRLRPGLAGTVLGPRVGGWPLLLVDFVVEDVDEGARRWSWRVEPRRAVLPVPGPVRRWARMRLVHAVMVGDGGSGAVTTLEVTGSAPVVLAYALPAWWALRRLVR